MAILKALASGRKFAAVGVLATLMLLAIGCSSNRNPETSSGSAQSQPAATPIDPVTAATVSGTVTYNGPVPKPAKIDMSQDPACQGDATAESVAVENGRLADAFVYVKEGLGNRSFPPPQQKVILEQQGCRYHPHVLGIMTNQVLEIRNDDGTMHNVHPAPRDNREWNDSQGPHGAPLEKTFANPEIMIPVKCNQHPWMKMYLNVVSNPFFAVTDKNGNFKLKGLPPGEYTIAVVQEKLGEQTRKIEVGPKESKTVDFAYGSGLKG